MPSTVCTILIRESWNAVMAKRPNAGEMNSCIQMFATGFYEGLASDGSGYGGSNRLHTI